MATEVREGVKVYSSDEARAHWRDIMDVATGGGDVVVERYGKPMVAVIPYEDYMSLLDALEELRDARDAAEAYARYKRNPEKARPYSEIRQELVENGRLDE